MNGIRQSVATHTCAVCRKGFQPGDRVVTLFIVQKVGANPAAQVPWEKGAFLGDEFELAHRACENPKLDGRIITP